MVLWEITLATAYCLGLRRTYRIALKLQRRLFGPRYPRIRNFLQRRTRNVFDVALKVHKEIQKRDLSAGKSIGNSILRFLDRARPSANIRGAPAPNQKTNGQKADPAGDSTGHECSVSSQITAKSDSKAHDKLLFTQYRLKAPFGQTVSSMVTAGVSKMYPSIHMTKAVPGARSISYLIPAWKTPSPRLWLASPVNRGVFRDDIAQWMANKPVVKSTAF